MSRTRLVAGLTASALAAALVGLAAGSGCGDGKAPQPTPEAPPAQKSAADELKERRAAAEKISETQRANLDKRARGLLASCDARVYRPVRDSALERAAGQIDVKAGDKEATYRFAFDVANKADQPVTFETVSEPAGWDAAITADVRRWGLVACVSAYEVVAYYRPPTQLFVVPSGDGKSRTVVVPHFRTPLNVSYSVNAENVIAARGEWTDEDHKFVTNYEWEQIRGIWLLRGAKVLEGASTRFEYDDRGDLLLLRTIHVGDRTPAVDAQITFESIQRRSN